MANVVGAESQLEGVVDKALGERILALRQRIVSDFTAENWEELGLLTGTSDLINHHPRLLRSLSWNDEDYAGNVLTVLRRIIEQDPRTLSTIEEYLDKNYAGESTFISAKTADRKITFSPHVFRVPEGYVEPDLIALMMPFSAEFNLVHEAILRSAMACRLRCFRADSIWEEATIIQDIFNLIFRAQVVIVDFTGRNPNVMYETGIAHTLGKHVIPISQSLDDVPFDMRHHRVLKYLSNGEGLSKMASELERKLMQFAITPVVQGASEDSFDDDIPF